MSSPLSAVPRVGVAVIVVRDGRVLVGRRLGGTQGNNSWQFPGGHLEHGESIADCAIREVAEETGLDVTVTGFGPFTNDIFEAAGKHYVTLFVLATAPVGSPRVLEPEKCAEWCWCEWDTIPKPRFLSVQHLLEQRYRPPGVV
ncbi:nucleotide triphosphate diphosphatase NUDT15 [Gemmatimonas sp.]|uniref:nucleotide triphosphate diphosphatase NUDT15 n=1 Tax=Gemmatimonas sp. TaxID=1962908 RepID=UPI003982ED2E